MGLFVTVDGSWEISDSFFFIVTWCDMKCDVFGIKEMLYYTIMSKNPYRGRIFLFKKCTVKTVTTLVSPTKAFQRDVSKTILTAIVVLRPAEWKSCLIESAHLVLERPLRLLLGSAL